jgi:hypothetical protein
MSDSSLESRIVQKQAAEQRRYQWATSVALMAVGTHLLAILVVCGWYYVVVPRWKQGLGDSDVEVTNDMIFVITLSDAFVSLWWLTLPLIAAFLCVDFVITRWLVQRIGLRCTAFCVAGLAIVILAQLVVGAVLMRSPQPMP